MKNFILTITLTLYIVSMIGCDTKKSVEGSYIVLKENKPFKSHSKYVIATLGKKNISFNPGASGTYEVSNNKVIVQGKISHVFTIKGDDLVSDNWYLKKSTEKEIKLLQKQAKKEEKKNKPIIGDEKAIGY